MFCLNDEATTENNTLSLHDALPIFRHRLSPLASANLADRARRRRLRGRMGQGERGPLQRGPRADRPRSEEHTSELQSRQYLVCRLLLEKNLIHSFFSYSLLFIFFSH